MVPGTNGLPGLPALPLALMEQCSAHESVTAHHTEAQTAVETGVNPATASLETAQVCPYSVEVDILGRS